MRLAASSPQQRLHGFELGLSLMGGMINCQKNCQYSYFIEMGIGSSKVGRGRKGFSSKDGQESPLRHFPSSYGFPS